MNKIYYIMGVSGTGKSTIGKQLSQRLHIPFYDGDDFHPKANIEKMKSGLPLNDKDRLPWLERLSELAQTELQKKGAVIACSALKKSYRIVLEKNIAVQTHWVFLQGTPKVILERMKSRTRHFMPAALLHSQFDTLEFPENALTFSILDPPEKIVDAILKYV